MLLLNNKQIEYFTFPGGEIQVKLPTCIHTERVILIWKPTEAWELTLLIMTVDALNAMGVNDIDLDILYLPYARQDRVCSPGEARSLDVICGILNDLKICSLRIWDVHNYEATFNALPNAVFYNIEPQDIFARYKILDDFDLGNLILCSPDDGAYDRVNGVVNKFELSIPITMSKFRCPETGKILSIKFGDFNREVDGWNILLIDDICDGGSTFIQSAQILKEKGANKLFLYVTHGIFSKGLDLLQQYFSHIYCHHVLHDDKFKSTDKLTILSEYLHEN